MIPMTVKTLIKPSEYHDSVSLMLTARELSKLEGVRDAAVVMATEANKSILADAGLLTDEVKAATPNDLVIAVSSETESLADAALQKVDGLLKKKTASSEAGVFQIQNHPRRACLASGGECGGHFGGWPLRRGRSLGCPVSRSACASL